MDVDDLYGLPLDRFVAERTALARELRAAGRREEAAAVAKLRKPSLPAWAVNQLVRTQGRAIARLLKAGQGLRDAQSKALAGRGGAPALRTASEREREVVGELLHAARGLLTSDGHDLSSATLERVGETLHAAALDDDAGLLVRGGRLERELRHVGFGFGDVAALPAPRKTRSTRKGGAAEPTRRAPVGREPAKSELAERARANARKAAQAAEAETRRRVTRTARAVALAEERRERAKTALREAEAVLASARAEAEAAAAAHRGAEARLNSI